MTDRQISPLWRLCSATPRHLLKSSSLLPHVITSKNTSTLTSTLTQYERKTQQSKGRLNILADSSINFLLALVASLASTSLRQLLLVPLHLQHVFCSMLKKNFNKQQHVKVRKKALVSPDVLEKAVKCGSNPSSEPEKKNTEDKFTGNFGFM